MPIAENARPGDPHWAIRHLGAEHEIEGYAGQVSVRQGESFPLFVSSTSPGYRVTAYRLGWYQGYGARQVWQSGPLRGHRQNGPVLAGPTNTIRTDWDPALDVPTDDWPPGSYLLRLDADSGGQRYVPVTVRSETTAGKVVLKNGVETWQAYNTWGGYDLYKGPDGAYANRSLVVSLDRPYDDNGAAMFLTYERNVVKLAELIGLPLAYVTSMDIAADPHLLDGASALISLGHDEYWSPSERANVTAARDAGVNLAFLGANALFRRTRLEATPLGTDRMVVCYKTSYRDDPMYGKDASLVTSDWRAAPSPDPESSLIGTLYESYPATAAYRVVSPRSWVFKGTGVPAGATFAQPGRHRIRPGQPRLPGSAADRGAVALPAGLPGRQQLRRLRLLHPLRRGGRLQRGHDALGGGDLRRPAARDRRYGDRLRPPGHHERAPGLRRRPRGRLVPRPRQPGRDARIRR